MSEAEKQKAEFESTIREYVGVPEGPPYECPDAVNEAMIRHWCEAMGDANSAYLDSDAAEGTVHGGIVAPPTMLQTWDMRGYAMHDATRLLPQNNQRKLHATAHTHRLVG